VLLKTKIEERRQLRICLENDRATIAAVTTRGAALVDVFFAPNFT
jgi:hypothetical protein